jgi:hypothetical protein
MMIGYDIYDCFTMEHFRLRQRMTLTTKNLLLATVLQQQILVPYYWGHGKLGRCVIQLSKFLNHTLATHNQA